MAGGLPSDDEIRAALRRGRPSRIFETVGCVAVLACAAVGAVLGFIAFEKLDAAWSDRGLGTPLWVSLVFPAGGMVGLVVGTLIFQLTRRLVHTRRVRRG